MINNLKLLSSIVEFNNRVARKNASLRYTIKWLDEHIEILNIKVTDDEFQYFTDKAQRFLKNYKQLINTLDK